VTKRDASNRKFAGMLIKVVLGLTSIKLFRDVLQMFAIADMISVIMSTRASLRCLRS
jgi:hypothetical protein